MARTPEETREGWLTIGRYYAYGECIENRVAAASSVRAHSWFFNRVFRYVSLFFKISEPIEALRQQEKQVWKQVAECHDTYLTLLKGRLGFSSAHDVNLTFRSGRNNFQAAKNSYEQLIKVDKLPCAFAEMMSTAKEDTLIKVPKDTAWRISELLETLEKVMDIRDKIENALDSKAKKIADAKGGQQAEKIVTRVEAREPRSVYASLFVFVSHLGRCVAWQCNNAEPEDVRMAKASKEINNSVQHLHRAILDAYKLLHETILRRHEENALKKKNNLLTEAFWRQLLEARRMEHDRREHSEAEFDEKVKAYDTLFFPHVDNFLRDLEHSSS